MTPIMVACGVVISWLLVATWVTPGDELPSSGQLAVCCAVPLGLLAWPLLASILPAIHVATGPSQLRVITLSGWRAIPWSDVERLEAQPDFFGPTLVVHSRGGRRLAFSLRSYPDEVFDALRRHSPLGTYRRGEKRGDW